MAKGEARTPLTTDSTLNITWHLGYPHGGGYKVELICPDKNKTYQLLPTNTSQDWFTEEARYSQSHMISLPQGLVCNNCHMRLQRQATEWGKKYIFRSCADVKVGPGNIEECGDGEWDGEGCVCPRGRIGDRCQYQTDCQSDIDCHGDKGHGRCIVTDSTVYPIGQCYCTAGWQGLNCEIENKWDEKEARRIKREEYKTMELSEGVTLLWRKPGPGLVEFVMTAQTDSWVGLGWRPKDAKKNCQAFPSKLPKPRGRDFHPMDCTDMVIGSSRDGLGRVGDYYTRDRSTPRIDRDYGGESDIVQSHAWEEDGATTMRVVRNSVGGVADHPLQGKMLLIWAHGRKADIFYKPDQLKYHGRGKGRGLTSLDLED